MSGPIRNGGAVVRAGLLGARLRGQHSSSWWVECVVDFAVEKVYGKPALLCVANLFGRLGLRGGWCGLWAEVLRPQLRPMWVVAIRVVPGVAPFEWLIHFPNKN